MPTIRRPRKGSLQFWPRRRSKRVFARVRSWTKIKDAKPLGFAGYKVGMTHLIITDDRKTSTTKGMGIFCPATIIECPPLKTASIKFYKNTTNGLKVASETLAENLDKELGKKIAIPKKSDKKKDEKEKDFDFIRLLVYTQPKLTGIGKKKPELFEIGLGGNKEDQVKYANEKLGKEIIISEVFKEGQQLDVHAVTKGKGMQGPVKRFGISLKNHKSEKGRRTPGSLGGWIAQGHIMWRNAKAGKMGYHPRTEYNKWLLKIGEGKDVNVKGGLKHYGVVKNTYILVKGSIIGTEKRLIRINEPSRPNKILPNTAPTIQNINLVKAA
ncbi:50S ribosomal protein L3 [archaeon]|jgi:large subunit ribosomal protein L3|nr:50S ribosomal protein L3 [archaeon]MDP6548269.1 50S ribosomal protein L3 [Candidatus Woesearchaeota archaeon]|tara:strand:+ start:9481 stop:10458 length:978 start_codon:yes stop_codon:yes gene_type:complete